MNEDEQQVCDERDGWCVLGTTDKLRDIISAMIKTVIRAHKPSLPEFPKRRRRVGQNSKFSGRDHADEEEQDDENKDDEDEDEEDEFEPSEGSENEMETEILDYM
ncbi:general transcription factor 3C polypeptide 5-like [Lycodopsis pacificus]